MKKTVKARRRAEIQVDELTELKFDEFKEERKNKLKALSSGYVAVFGLAFTVSLEAPFSESPRLSVSETDASDSEEEVEADDIIASEPACTPATSVPSRRHSLSIPNNLNHTNANASTIKRTTLKNPPTREKSSHPQHQPLSNQSLTTTPPPAKENPRKRRRSEIFTSTTSSNNKENFDILPPPPAESDLFSPMNTGNNNDKAQRGVLAESSPTRPSIIIPAGLTSLESPNKPMNNKSMNNKGIVNKTMTISKDPGISETPMSPLKMATGLAKEVPEFLLDMDEGGGRRVSRARKQVNYALPNLRDKMRREDNFDEKGVRQRSRSMDRSVTPDLEVVYCILQIKLILDEGGGIVYETTASVYQGSYCQI